MKNLILTVTLASVVAVGPGAGADEDPPQGSQAAGLVTSADCAGQAIPVAPADSVLGRAEDGTLGDPVGEPIVTSEGPMYRLDASEERDEMITSNAVRVDAPWYLCTAGADGAVMLEIGEQLADTATIISDPESFVPPPDNYYPETLSTDGHLNQFWLGRYDAESDTWVGDWLFITAHTSGPVYNSPNAFMRDALGNASRRYAVVAEGFAAFVVYRPEVEKVSANCYKAVIGSVAAWRPPVRTCGTPIANP